MVGRKVVGFTLIELLVVVAIIVVLVAVLVPALAQSKVSAKQSVCGTNLRSIAQASAIYSQENGDLLVPTSPLFSFDSVNVYNTAWFYQKVMLRVAPRTTTYSFQGCLLQNTLQSTKTLTCPETVNLNLIVSASQGVMNTYSLTDLLVSGTSTDTVTHATQINSPASTALAADAISFNYISGKAVLTTPLPDISPNSSNAIYDQFQGRHTNGGGNVAFYDSHVELVAFHAKPIAAYLVTPTAAAYAEVLAQHVGPILPSSPDWSTATDYPSYKALCMSSLDYDFWAAK